MKKKKWFFMLAVTVIVFVSVIGGPLIINKLYKMGPGFVTVWSGADVLSFYSNVLGSTITVAVLAVTIAFTKKQIQRERFLERNRAKWENVESIITQALIDISPLRMQNITEVNSNDSLLANILTSIYHLQTYTNTAKTSLDMVKCYVNPAEYEQISSYLQTLTAAIVEFCAIASELQSQYMILQNIAIVNKGKIPDEAVLICINNTNNIIKKIPPAYTGPYQDLLDGKGSTFEKIYTNLDEQANSILTIGKKDGVTPCPPLNGSEKKE